MITYVICHLSIQPYLLVLNKTKAIDYRNKFAFYEDLDGNGSAEIIYRRENSGVANIHIDSDKNFNEQGNLRGNWLLEEIPFVGDYDNNGLKEVYGLTLVEDSIMLTAYEYGSYDKPLFERFLVSTSAKSEDLTSNRSARFYDFNHDGFDELLISLTAGYAIDPRILLVWDIANDSLWTTPMDWGTKFQLYDIHDFDNNGSMDIVAISRVSRNIHNSAYVYGDKVGYIFILDWHLNLQYPAYRLPNNDQIIYINIQGLPTVFNFKQSSDESTQFLTWEDGRWNSVNIPEKLESSKVYIEPKMTWRNTQIAGLYNYGNDLTQCYFLNEELKLRKTPENIDYSQSYIDDFTGNGMDEILTYDANELKLYSGEKWTKSSITLSEPTHRYSSGFRFGAMRFMADSSGTRFFFEIRKNPLYQWLWAISISTGLVLSIIAGFVIRYRQYRRQAFNNRLYALRLKSIKNHVDPHFTFNVLNSIRMLLIRNDGERAELYFDQYANLIRNSLINAENVSSTLGEECQLAQAYLSLERFRLKESFDYEIICTESLEGLTIPKMLIQTHLENAVKHGVTHLVERKGHIQLKVERVDALIWIIIKDNGIGRVKAKEIDSRNTGKGLEITQEIISLYNVLEGANIKQQVIDEAQGTLVKISLST